MVASPEALADVVAVAALELPQAHVAAGELAVGLLVEVLVGVGGVEPGGAEVAEVRLAAVADHVVAAVRLLGGGRARRAGRRVVLEVLDRRQLLGRQLAVLAPGRADDKLAVPRLEAPGTKSEAAVLADGEELVGFVKGLCLALALVIAGAGPFVLGARVSVVVVVLGHVGELEALGLLVLLGPGRAVAPGPRAVDCVLVRLELGLVLEADVALHRLLVEGDLQELAGADVRPGLLPLLARR